MSDTTTAPPAHARPSPAGTSIDPRLRARRIEVQRDVGRRRLRRVIDLGLVLAVALGFVAALRSPLLDVAEVQVTGVNRLDPTAVAEAAGVAPGDQLMDVDLGAVGRRVTALPWVAEATVDRRLDGTLAIDVVERTPAAVVGEGSGAVLVDASGHVLGRVAEVPNLAGSLVRVVGVPSGLEPGQALGPDAAEALLLAARLAADVPGVVAQVDAGGGLVATLADGGEVRFGDTQRLAAKVRALATVLTQVDLACLGQLDLRVPGSPVLTREEACS